MKNFLFILLAFIFITQVNSQISYGVSAGVQSSYFLDKYFYLDLSDRGDELLLKVQNGKYGLHLGAFTRLKIASVFIQPQLVFNSDNISYTIKDLNDIDNPSLIFHERFYSVTVPVKFGIKRSIFTFHTGPVANYQLLSISKLWKNPDFNSQFNQLTWSVTFGLGIDLALIRLDLSIEQGLGKYGDHLQIDGKTYQFSKNPGRIVSSLYIAL